VVNYSLLTLYLQVRLALVLILWRRPHLLILDEITTHLDFYTVAGLSRALSAFNGAVVLVAHDRYMIRRVIEGIESLSDEEETGNPSENDESAKARRILYQLKGGNLKPLDGGMQEFEQTLEKRVAKLLID
jgi:ATPase subunit of ABC transporter with duplicated ATPase domains